MTLTSIEIPENEWQTLEPYKNRLGELLLLGLSQVRIQEALLMYQRGVVSFGRAAELAGVSEEELTRHACAAGVQPQWTSEMLTEEMA